MSWFFFLKKALSDVQSEIHLVRRNIFSTGLLDILSGPKKELYSACTLAQYPKGWKIVESLKAHRK